MKPPLPLPPKGGAKTRFCERCGLRRPDGDDECPHCAELDDTGVESLKRRRADQQAGHARLGRQFAIAAVAIAVILMLLMLE